MSCSTGKRQDNTYLEINNKELERQIIEYASYTDSTMNNSTYILNVYCFEVNDSTSRYVISSDIEPKSMKDIPYHFICKVGERDVFFTMLAGVVRKDWGKRNFFILKESAYVDFVEKYFPEKYKEYLEFERKKLAGTPIPEKLLDFYEPEMCYLTFVYDKLVKKEMRSGLPWW